MDGVFSLKDEKNISIEDVESFVSMEKAMKENQITVTAVGLYNHGKSTLLNVLIKDFELKTFKTADARETSANKTIKYKDINYVDTPGLNANEYDDKILLKAIENTDIILFIHNITTGEFNKKEIEFLKKIKETDVSSKEFIERTVFVLSRIDGLENSEDIKRTQEKMMNQINSIFYSYPIIVPVSASRYLKGILEKKQIMIKKSNIELFEKRISQLKIKLEKSIKERKENRFKDKCNELINKLEIQNIEIDSKINKLNNENNKIIKNFNNDIKKIEETLKNLYLNFNSNGR